MLFDQCLLNINPKIVKSGIKSSGQIYAEENRSTYECCNNLTTVVELIKGFIYKTNNLHFCGYYMKTFYSHNRYHYRILALTQTACDITHQYPT